MSRLRRLSLMALFIAMAVVLHWLEGFLPRPLPFMRWGFANIFTLCALYLFGGAAGLTVAICRVVMAALLTGSIFTPSFAFAMAGGLAAGLCMWLMPQRWFTAIGISVMGASAHMMAQLSVAALMIRHTALLGFIPGFVLVAVLSGVLNGYATMMVLDVALKRGFSMIRQDSITG